MAQTGCNENGQVTDVTVNPGNAHNSVVFGWLYNKIVEKNYEIEVIVANAGYKVPWISKKVIDDGFPYKRPMGKKDFSNLMNMYTISIMTVSSVLKVKY